MPENPARGEAKAPFLCECGASLCDERVWLSASDYDRRRDVGPALAETHTPGEAGALRKCPACGRSARRKRR